MRMWMVDPRWMCRNHLLGEHRETHLFQGALRKKRFIDAYLFNGLLDPRYLQQRHDELVIEMNRRAYLDFTPMQVPDYSYLGLKDEPCYITEAAMHELLHRCPECRRRYIILHEES